MTKSRFLVCHDYGMGGLWWWVWAGSAEEIRQRVADVVVVTGSEAIDRAEGWSLAEVDVDAPDPNPLSDLMAARAAQRTQSGFGALIGRGTVYVSEPWDDPDGSGVTRYLMEIGQDGYRTRQVDVHPDGTAVRSTDDDWPLNPPFDLYEPRWAGIEISAEDFERAWDAAGPASGEGS